MEKKIEGIIIKATCSKSLQKAIATTKFKMTEIDLLVLTYKHAPTYEKRIELLKLIELNADSVLVRKQANECITFEEQKLKRFIEDEPNCVFDVRIKDEPNSLEECYLAKTYHGALDKIRFFKKRYSFVRFKESSRTKIVKRKVVDDLTEKEFNEDWRGEANYKGRAILTEVSHEECPDTMLHKAIKRLDRGIKDFTHKAPKLPRFLKDMDVVCFDFFGEITYAIIQVFEDASSNDIEYEDDCAYCIVIAPKIFDKQINSEEQFYERIVGAHQHIEYPRLTIIQPSDLPAKEREVHGRIIEMFQQFAK